MGRVTPYQQGQLASSVTGVSGVDISPLGLGSAVMQAQAASANAQQAVSAAQMQQNAQLTNYAIGQVGQAMQYNRQVKDRIDALQAENVRQQNVATMGTGINTYITDLVTNLKRKHVNSPGDANTEYLNSVEQYRDTMLNGAEDPKSRAELNTALSGKIDSGYNNLNTWAEGRTDVLSAQRYGASIDALKQSAASIQPGDLDSLTNLVHTWERDNSEEIFKLRGADANNFISNVRKDVVLNAMANMSLAQPGTVVEAYKSGQLSKLLEPSDVQAAVRGDITNMDIVDKQMQENLSKEGLDLHNKFNEASAQIAEFASSDPAHVVTVLRSMKDEIESYMKKPQDMRDQKLVDYMYGKFVSGINEAERAKLSVAKEMRETNVYNQAQASLELTKTRMTEQLTDKALQEIQQSPEAQKTLRDLSDGLRTVYFRVGDAREKKKPMPYNATQFRGFQIQLEEARAKNHITAAQYVELSGLLSKSVNGTYNPNQDKAALDFLFYNHGPSDKLVAAMGIPRTDAKTGQINPQFNTVRDLIQKRADAKIEASKVQQGLSDLSPLQKNALYDSAQFEIFHEYATGKDLPGIPKPKVNVVLPMLVPALNPADIRKKQEQVLSGEAAVNTSPVLPGMAKKDVFNKQPDSVSLDNQGNPLPPRQKSNPPGVKDIKGRPAKSKTGFLDVSTKVPPPPPGGMMEDASMRRTAYELHKREMARLEKEDPNLKGG